MDLTLYMMFKAPLSGPGIQQPLAVQLSRFEDPSLEWRDRHLGGSVKVSE